MTDMNAAIFEQFTSLVLHETGAIAHRYFHNIGEVATKADASPVTIADQEIEACIRGHIGARFPQHNIIGEEGEDKKTTSNYCWIIDPIDGTKAFIAGQPTFTTLIGLLYNGAPLFGVVDQPIIPSRWSNSKSAKPALSGAVNQPESTTIATTSRDFMSSEQLAALENWAQKNDVHVQYGGDAYAYMQLLEGKVSAVFDLCLKPYDILPLLPILAQDETIIVQFLKNGTPCPSPTGDVIVSRNLELTESIVNLLAA